jgi:hypothetical protein
MPVNSVSDSCPCSQKICRTRSHTLSYSRSKNTRIDGPAPLSAWVTVRLPVARNSLTAKRRSWSGGRGLPVRVQCREPITTSQRSRYLIDFIADISDVSSGLSPLYSAPGVDSNSLSDQHPPNESTLAHYACQLPDGRPYDQTLGRATCTDRAICKVAESGFRAPATYQKLKVAEKHRPLSGHMHASPYIIVEELSGRPFEIT